MISWDLDPFYTRGGTAYAIRRLADQLVELGIETTVLLPDRGSTYHSNDVTVLPVNMRNGIDRAPRVVQCSEFCRAALEMIGKSDAFIAHSDEGAMFIALQSEKRRDGPSIFWLHSLYDPPIDGLSKDERRLLPSSSLLASAVVLADIVVTSSGVLKDGREFVWPHRLQDLQQALRMASAEGRVLTVESMGCLPKNSAAQSSNLETLKNLPRPYVLFPGRPSIDKGFGIFAAIAERLRADNISCVAVQRPTAQAQPDNRSRNAPIHWLPWLAQDELLVAMRNAACTVLPSLTEGFGLAAAESISHGVKTLYHEVGGHHNLREFPNALPVPLEITETAYLYGLWSELLDVHPDSWDVWMSHETSLRSLVDRWVEAIRSVVHRRDDEIKHFSEPPIEERWGNKLREHLLAKAQRRKERLLKAARENT
jgi:glycosyltransferase involved in cell wall biosynthesis